MRAAYDIVAAEYAERFADELSAKPLDRRLLREFARSVREAGLVCDLGCGPGQIGAYLGAEGLRVRGIDVSEENLRQARRLHPQLEFARGDMLALDVADEAFAGVVAFYAICHLSLEELERACAEMHRVLEPGGRLLVAFHVGDETIHVEELLGRTARLDFVLFPVEAVTARLAAVDFAELQVTEREPYPEVEAQTRRAYVRATKAPVTAARSG